MAPLGTVQLNCHIAGGEDINMSRGEKGNWGYGCGHSIVFPGLMQVLPAKRLTTSLVLFGPARAVADHLSASRCTSQGTTRLRPHPQSMLLE